LRDRIMDETHEKKQNLWMFSAAPLIWSSYFLLAYITAAMHCSKMNEPDASTGSMTIMIAIYTAIALTGIGLVGWYGHRRHRHGSETGPHDFDTQESRHRFLGFAILLLSGLSAIATIYVGIVVIFLRDCN
jgi:hypothetical protein